MSGLAPDGSVADDGTEDELPDIVRVYRDFFERPGQMQSEEMSDLLGGYPLEKSSYAVDWSQLHAHNQDVADRVLTTPDKERERAVAGLLEADFGIAGEAASALDSDDLTIRWTNIPESRSHVVGGFSPAKAVGELATVRGQVSHEGSVKPVVDEAAYSCQRCGTLTRVSCGHEPQQCVGCEKPGPFDFEQSESNMVDQRKIIVQTPPETGGSTEIPAYVVGGLVEQDGDGQLNGKRVEVTATIDGTLDESGDNDIGDIVDLYGRVEAVETAGIEWGDIETEEHEERLREIAAGDTPHEILAQSLVPELYGLDEIKMAVAHQMVGGSGTVRGGSRGVIHVLLVGDPGTGKSDLLRHIEKFAPIYRYVNAPSSTGVGLTAAGVQGDDGRWMIKGGALVRADGGICAIDELDKMPEEDRSGLLQSMQDGLINANKGDAEAELPARTAILAAANPKHGRYDDFQTIAEQFDLGSALVNRFDLRYAPRDEVDMVEDKKKAVRVFKNAIESAKKAKADNPSEVENEVERPLSEEEVRAWIALARDLNPTPPDEEGFRWAAKQYHQLRNMDSDAIPANPRQCAAMHRLATASARIRLSEDVTKEDYERAFAMMMESMKQVAQDPETGELDADMVESGQSKSQRDRMRNIKGIIEELSNTFEDGAPRDILLERVEVAGIDPQKAEHALQKLSDKGEVYEPKSDHLRLVANRS
jgi:replicative DNA helicase Mcm